MTHVPYRGSAPSTAALISGQIDVLFVDLGPMLPQIKAGKARVKSETVHWAKVIEKANLAGTQ
jgi:tripartite-type tricarboxylate transporter receptor subunit TctC